MVLSFLMLFRNVSLDKPMRVIKAYSRPAAFLYLKSGFQRWMLLLTKCRKEVLSLSDCCTKTLLGTIKDDPTAGWSLATSEHCKVAGHYVLAVVEDY